MFTFLIISEKNQQKTLIYILNVAIIATLTISKITSAKMAVVASKKHCKSIGAD